MPQNNNPTPLQVKTPAPQTPPTPQTGQQPSPQENPQVSPKPFQTDENPQASELPQYSTDSDWLANEFSGDTTPGDEEPGASGNLPVGFEPITDTEFFGVFCMPFQIARGGISARVGADITSLDINRQTPGAVESARAMYEICKEVPFLRFMVDRRSKVFMNGLVLSGFLTGVVSAARAELAEKRPNPPMQASQTGKKDGNAKTVKHPNQPYDASINFSVDPALAN